MGGDLVDAVARRTASVSRLTAEDLEKLREQMTLSLAHQFQPDVVQDFTQESMMRLRGDLQRRGEVWVARHVPERVRRWPGQAELLVRPRYDLLTFSRDPGTRPVASRPELVSPGHPLLTALAGVVSDDHGAHLQRGIILEDDRTAESYVLVTLGTRGGAGSNEAHATSMVTFRVRNTFAPELVDASAYTSLNTSSPMPDDEPRTQTANAVARVRDDREGEATEILAVAYVRGTASPAVESSWEEARSGLRGALSRHAPITPALPFEGWDYSFRRQGSLHFVTAIPDGVDVPTALRRSERIAARNLGTSYHLCVAGGSDPRWLTHRPPDGWRTSPTNL